MKTERERKLEAAMQFYARHKTWNAEPYEVAPAIIDAGRNAREALADEGSGGEPPDGWVACDCVGQFGPNPGCGRCGGDGTVYEGSGGGDGMVPPPHDSLRAALRDSSKKVADGKLADDTPPQQRDALEDALHRLEAWDDDTYCDSPHARWADVGQVRRAVENVNAKYHELLYAVATKHSGESRHETALRYIQQAENRPTYCGAAQDAAPAPGPEKE